MCVCVCVCVFFFFFLVFRDRISLCSFGYNWWVSVSVSFTLLNMFFKNLKVYDFKGVKFILRFESLCWHLSPVWLTSLTCSFPYLQLGWIVVIMMLMDDGKATSPGLLGEAACWRCVFGPCIPGPIVPFSLLPVCHDVNCSALPHFLSARSNLTSTNCFLF